MLPTLPSSNNLVCIRFLFCFETVYCCVAWAGLDLPSQIILLHVAPRVLGDLQAHAILTSTSGVYCIWGLIAVFFLFSSPSCVASVWLNLVFFLVQPHNIFLFLKVCCGFRCDITPNIQGPPVTIVYVFHI